MNRARPPSRPRLGQSPDAASTNAPANARTVIVARAAYRHRRMIYAAALFPIAGAILLVLPLLWERPDGGAARTSHVLIYVFTVWTLLVILSAAITRGLGIGARTGAEARAEAGAGAANRAGTDDAPRA